MILQVLNNYIYDVLLLLFTLIFALRFHRRPHFAVRLCALSAAFGFGWFVLVSFLWAFLRSSPMLLYALQFHSLALIAVVCAVVGLCWQIDPRNLLHCGAMGYALQALASNFNGSWADPFPAPISRAEVGANCAKHLFAFLLVLAVGWVFFARRTRRVPTDVKPSIRVCLLSIFIVVLSCILLPSQFFRYEDVMATQGVNQTLRIFNIVFCTVMLELQTTFLRVLEEHDANDRLNWLLEQKRDQYEAAKATAELIRVKYHDLKHYLNSEHERAQIGEMLSEDMMEGIQRYDAQFNTGCNALDVVLTEKAMRCIREKVAFSCMADGAALAFMRPVDVYALFSNALDNAIEAVCACAPERRVISMDLRQRDGFLCLSIENYCENELSWRDGELVSSKSEGDWHGYGTKSIGMIVEKYGGTLQMQIVDGMFTLNAVFFQAVGQQAA